MMLNDFAIWSFAVFGLSMILSISKIGKWIQGVIAFYFYGFGLEKLLKCPMCNAFWIGIIYHLTWKQVTGSFLVDGFLASGVVLFMYCICWDLAISDKEF